MVETRTLALETHGQLDLIDITDRVQKAVNASKIGNGIVTIFCPGSTGAITTIEYEPGLKQDFREFFAQLLPYHHPYRHHATWGDDNGSGHLQSALLKTSFTVPIVEGRLTLGTWQQIIFCECDTRARSRELVLQILGE